MEYKLVDTEQLDNDFRGIADAIREKNGTENTYKPSEMPQAIKDIESGGSDSWTRPADWLPEPEMSTEYDEIWMLMHVSKEYGGGFIYEKGSYTVDWGDGVVENKSNGSDMHYYDYSELDENSETNLGFRQCWCRVYRERGTLDEFYVGHNYLSNSAPDIISCVELIINTTSDTAYAKQYSSPFIPFLRHVKIISDNGIYYSAYQNMLYLEYIEGKIKPTPNLRGRYQNTNLTFTDIKCSFPEVGESSGQNLAQNCIARKFEVDCDGVNSLANAFFASKIREIVLSNTQKCTDFTNAFNQAKAISIKGLDLSNATNISSAFHSCYCLTFDSSVLSTINPEKIINAYSAFRGIRLNSFPDFKTPNCTNVAWLFYSSRIKKIGTLDFSSATSADQAFYYCYSLEEVSFVEGSIPVSLSFAHSGKLSTASVDSIINGLADLTRQDSQTLTVNKDVFDRMSDEQKAFVTSKNWTLASSK